MRTPNCRAISAAVRGEMSPRLLAPSVSRMMTLLLALLSLRREMALASPIPMAVPSSIMPVAGSWHETLRNMLSSTAWSMVRGHCVNASPAKMVRPMLSFGRLAMNSCATALAASMRSGLRSCAHILVEMSSTIMMSIPSVWALRQEWLVCGRARTTMTSASVSIRRQNGNWTRAMRGVFRT